ncbi:TetR/AcrR family transcriptional regulator C-terminal domain-containing protein [Nonomuraea sp. NPDC049758]|uniref:TetR/AcrR family transcriptional regulator C-terminal domain-containing protein n=1 Tax=Nonomuraea sp. NPDC049758 TaxID=3154360 RepID=UPI003433359A
MRRLATHLGVAPMAPYRHVSGKDDLLELMVDHVYADLRVPGGLGRRPSLRALAVLTRELMLRHRRLAQLPPQAKLSLTPNRMTVAEQAPTALDGLGLDADTMMSAFRAVDAYVHGAVSYESAVSALVSNLGLSGEAELRDDLAPVMMWHMRTGRYPTFQHYLRTATRKDDASWQFALGLDCLRDGIAIRLGI